MRSQIGRKLRSIATTLVVLVLLSPGNAGAQDLDPRRYINLPVSQNFLRVALGYSDGEVNVSPGIPVEGANLTVTGFSLGYLRSMNLGGKVASFDVHIPRLCATGSGVLDGEQLSRDTCGAGDANVRLTYNFFGAPALELSEFAKRKKEVVVGASIQVSVPTGQYDPEHLVNIGANRWVLRPEIGMSIPWRNWSLDVAAGVRFFSDNDEYLVDQTFSQDPLYNLQAHLIYDLSNGHWISLDTNYFFGGETYRDDQPAAIRQENSRLGVNWYILVNSKLGVRLTANTGVVTRVGNDSNTFSLAALYRWE